MSKAFKGAMRPPGGLSTTQAPALATADAGALSNTQDETMAKVQTETPATMPGFTSIMYVGKRPEYIDGTYGTRLLFKQGESKWVPNDPAKKMLKHPDVYTTGDSPTTPAVKVEAKQHQKEEESLQDLRDSIANMDRDSLAKFAKIHYGQELGAEMSVADARQQVTMLVDQYGID